VPRSTTAGGRTTRTQRAATPGRTSADPPRDPPTGADIAGTHERILEVALDLFIRKGYTATSMREIAAPLGISKAALYYHFPSKSHIMLELHLQMHRAMADLHDVPEPGADDATWLRFVDQLIALALRNRRIIEFHFRNRDVFEDVDTDQGVERCVVEGERPDVGEGRDAGHPLDIDSDIVDVVQPGQETGDFRPGTDVKQPEAAAG